MMIRRTLVFVLSVVSIFACAAPSEEDSDRDPTAAEPETTDTTEAAVVQCGLSFDNSLVRNARYRNCAARCVRINVDRVLCPDRQLTVPYGATINVGIGTGQCSTRSVSVIGRC